VKSLQGRWVNDQPFTNRIRGHQIASAQPPSSSWPAAEGGSQQQAESRKFLPAAEQGAAGAARERGRIAVVRFALGEASSARLFLSGRDDLDGADVQRDLSLIRIGEMLGQRFLLPPVACRIIRPPNRLRPPSNDAR